MTNTIKLFFGFFLLFFQITIGAVEWEEIKPKLEPEKVLHAKYTAYPTLVHTNEKFEVKIEANILLPEDKEFSLFTDIPETPNLIKKTDEITWYKKQTATYEATITFQAKDAPFSFPIIGLSILDSNNTMIDKTLLVLDNIPFTKLTYNKDLYSNLEASSLSIDNLKVKQYNNDEILCSMEIHAKNSNLGDFKIPHFSNQGNKGLVNKNGEQILYYFVIVPLDTQSIKFEYYNSTSKQVLLQEIPVIVEEDLVSTQTDLNPDAGNLSFYKKVFYAFMATIFLMVYYYKRYKIALIFTTIFTVLLIAMLLPNSHMTLKKDQRVYILPTHNSTVFKVISEEEDVEVLVEKNGFKKILFKNNHIGWVKND